MQKPPVLRFSHEHIRCSQIGDTMNDTATSEACTACSMSKCSIPCSCSCPCPCRRARADYAQAAYESYYSL